MSAPVVAQADRQAAIDLMLPLCDNDEERANVLELGWGCNDSQSTIQAFARHRTAAEAAAKEREDALVEALGNVVLAHDNCSGCEPSVSLLARYIDEARTILARHKAGHP